MKQVIVRLRDCRVNTIKTIRKNYYYSKASYMENVFNDFKDILPGQEIYVKVGNVISFFISYEEVLWESAENKTDFDEELKYHLTQAYMIEHYIKEYLPTY